MWDFSRMGDILDASEDWVSVTDALPPVGEPVYLCWEETEERIFCTNFGTGCLKDKDGTKEWEFFSREVPTMFWVTHWCLDFP